MYELKFNSDGLIPAVVQDNSSGDVLMVAWMNAEAIRLSCDSGIAHFWSRSRKEMWRKGDTSGNIMEINQILVDCDKDTILMKVKPAGPACHTGRKSCFFMEINE
ncbi:MAG TPA: phosphoribosyl-AMP cyclohydrolase [Chloroflexi bacterium]|nr:phosphoribosyl-AMP cyclohydrolase [Chloroflexota bacterium]HCU97870.1 phosphoribosyl-AMP cyclohydrolase [Chloroflexota bacterium]|tara:strand:- start:3057 stop:3371 length:315 start_codon:yes stop_codon:yes gene_type:complete